MGHFTNRIKRYSVYCVIQKKFMNNKKIHKKMPVSFMYCVRTKHWIFLSYLHARLCFVTCDMLVTHVKEFVEAVIKRKSNRNRFVLDIASIEIFVNRKMLFNRDFSRNSCNALFRTTILHISFILVDLN